MLLLLLLLLLLLSLAYLPRNVGDVTCFENVVANVDGETAPSRHGLGDAFRFGLADTERFLSPVISVFRPRLGPGLEPEAALPPNLPWFGSNLLGLREAALTFPGSLKLRLGLRFATRLTTDIGFGARLSSIGSSS